MVVTRSSDAKDEKNVTNETSSVAVGEASGTDAPKTETGGSNDQSETLDSLLRAVEKINERLSEQVDQSATLAGQVARMSKRLEEKQLSESDSSAVEAAGESATHNAASLPMPPAARHFAGL